MTTWTSTTTSTAITLPVNWTNYVPSVKPEPERPLAWLDREVERTCALARTVS